MGRVQTGRVGRPNNLALAGIIISGIVGFLTLVTYVVLFVILVLMSDHNHPMCGAFDSSSFGCMQDSTQQDQQDDSGSTMPYHHGSGSDAAPSL
jgi:hypothetical protein